MLVVFSAGQGGGARNTPLYYFCQELCGTLAGQPSIKLAVPNPVDLSAALKLASEDDARLIFVLVAEREFLNATINLLDPYSIDVPPIPVVFDEGSASLELRKVSRDQIVDLVLIAVRSMSDDDEAIADLSAQVIDLGVRIRQAEQRIPASKPGDLVGVQDAELQGRIRDSMRIAADWVDAATNALVDLWTDEPSQENAVYGLSWGKLRASLDRLIGIRDAPMDKIAQPHGDIQAMLVDPKMADVPLVKLSRALGLDDLAFKFILVVLAPELDIRFQRLFNALQEDVGRRHASTALATAIIAIATEKATPRRIRLGLSALPAIAQFRLIEGFGDNVVAADEPLKLSANLLDWLMTGDSSRLTSSVDFDAIQRPSPTKALDLLPKGRRQEVERCVPQTEQDRDNPSGSIAFVLSGSQPGWIEIEAAALAGPELRIGPSAGAMAPETLDRLLREAIRASRLLGRRLVIDMIDPGPQGECFWRALLPLLPLCRPKPVVIASNPAWLLSVTTDSRLLVRALPPVGQNDRVEAINAAITGDSARSSLAAELAERYRLPLTALADAEPLAMAEAASAGRPTPEPIDWRAAFRSVAGSRLPQLARRVPPRPQPPKGAQLDRVVLPRAQRCQLESLVNHVKVGGRVLRDWKFGEFLDAHGVSALFTGESGTGKTTAAHAVASELGSDLYIVDLARIVSKYVGETEKHLDVIFTDAERAGAVLLFDEADALFGKRSAVSDAHDRYANIEVAYLLQRVEAFEGLAILTTNHPANIDPAFSRRLRFTVEFPFPEAQYRQLIWEQAIPADSPQRGPNVDFLLASRRLEVNGGSIRQIVLHALMAAAATEDGIVTEEHLRAAARTELTRLGKHDKLAAADQLFSQVLRAA